MPAVSQKIRGVIRGLVRIATLPLVLIVDFSSRHLFKDRKIRVVLMNPSLFGHQSLEPEVFNIDRLRAFEKGSKEIWLCSIGRKSDAANSFIWEMLRSKLPTIPTWLVSSLSFWCRRLRLRSIHLETASIYRLNFLSRYPTQLPHDDEIERRRREILVRLPRPDLPYVVYTVRERNSVRQKYDPRNREIVDFVDSMSALIARGMNVIRLTSSTFDPIQQGPDGVLDWQVVRDGEPGDELALISGASFVVSTTTGGDCLALAYRIPVLYIDSSRLFLTFLGTEYSTFHIPRMIEDETGRNIQLAELFDRGLGWTGDYRDFDSAGVRVERSTPKTITKVVTQYFDLLYTSNADWCPHRQQAWRAMLLKHHSKEVRMIHGEIKARMHPYSWSYAGIE